MDNMTSAIASPTLSSKSSPSILIADDDPRILTTLKLLLKSQNYQVVAVSSPAELLTVLARRSFCVALIDLNYQDDTTSGKEGLALVAKIRELDEYMPIVVMTGYSSVDIAVEAMKQGAADFVQKPWKNERLLNILQAQVHIQAMAKKGQKLTQENALLKAQNSHDSENIVAESIVMQQLLAQLAKLAKSDMNILFTGENGTGKSMFAGYLHQCSQRHQQSLISVNMGAITDNLFESEMFGHVKGAFTDAKETRIGRFELAEGGTIFLDEIANIPLSQQAKLLRVLEEKQFEKVGSAKTQQVDVRLVSATNASLAELISQGKFRQDLLYRINTIEIHIPALRDRVADILPLAEYFLIQFASKYGLASPQLCPQASTVLQNYQWPGNIRELSHMMERAIFLSQEQVITAADLGLTPEVTVDGTSFVNNGIDSDTDTLEKIERQIIVDRLARFDNNGHETAESLGLSRSSYYRRLEKHKL
ncbi:sigma-54-dependent transcriptional regulator [Colwellia psychrerythraea]|uniref:Two component, sigma54 specific, transcriptional regulator, Fis family n=1 Tax=Colwellia psychrerythraea TaxID=28229 RepID=A0A099KNC7_COLPS|nr:sigma-54 dependent transcriptional regulator [Colwellia psychrerythraea]KGJ92274.1 two component, sigma54 specific, transcriptional regulator, Fis family [Colwellia psychrerythraea]